MYMYVHNHFHLLLSLSAAGFECRQYTHYEPTTHLFDCEGALKDLSVSSGKCDHTRCISVHELLHLFSVVSLALFPASIFSR